MELLSRCADCPRSCTASRDSGHRGRRSLESLQRVARGCPSKARPLVATPPFPCNLLGTGLPRWVLGKQGQNAHAPTYCCRRDPRQRTRGSRASPLKSTWKGRNRRHHAARTSARVHPVSGAAGPPPRGAWALSVAAVILIGLSPKYRVQEEEEEGRAVGGEEGCCHRRGEGRGSPACSASGRARGGHFARPPPPSQIPPQAQKKARANRSEIFKRAEQYVKEYRSQVRAGRRGIGRGGLRGMAAMDCRQPSCGVDASK